MSCYISSGVALGCSDGIGGIKTIYVLGATGATEPSVSSVSISGATGPITGITGAGTWFQFELKRNTSSLTQEVQKSYENGSIFFNQTLVAVLYKYDQDKRNQLKLLSQNDQLQIIAVDQNDVQYYLGQTNGMYLSGGSAATGTALGDRNGFELTFLGNEPQPANVISGVLSSIFTAGGFND